MRLVRRQEDALESGLRAKGCEPRDGFVDQVVSRVSANGTRSRLQLALGIAAAAVGLAMFGAFGGLSYASSASQSIVHVISAKPSTAQSKSGSVNGSKVNTVQGTNASTNQYSSKVTICHVPPRGGFTLLAVNANALPGHKGHGDTLPGPGGTCPGPTIPD